MRLTCKFSSAMILKLVLECSHVGENSVVRNTPEKGGGANVVLNRYQAEAKQSVP